MHPTVPSTPDFTQSSQTGTNARTCTVELGLLILVQSSTSAVHVPHPYKRRFPVRFRVLTGLTHATLRADCGSCVLARLMHATGLCATGGCRIQASTRDRLVHKSGLCTRHYGMRLYAFGSALVSRTVVQYGTVTVAAWANTSRAS